MSESRKNLNRKKSGGQYSDIEPLIKTQWNQNEPYNLLCPLIDGKPDPNNEPQSAETVTQPLPQPSPDSVYPKKADREYFRSVTETTTYDEILRDIGPADYINGSGIITYHWKLDDGSVANVTFNYDSQVMTLIIVKDGEASEMIFR